MLRKTSWSRLVIEQKPFIRVPVFEGGNLLCYTNAIIVINITQQIEIAKYLFFMIASHNLSITCNVSTLIFFLFDAHFIGILIQLNMKNVRMERKLPED